MQPVQKLRCAHQRDQQLRESKSRLAERGKTVLDGLAIGGGLHAAVRVAKELLDDALLAAAAVGQQTSDGVGLGEGRIRQAGDLAFAVNRQLDLVAALPLAPGTSNSIASLSLQRPTAS